MPRALLAETQIHPAILAKVASWHDGVVAEVQQAITSHAVVVVGMRQNPFVRKAQRSLDAAGIVHVDLIYGSYLSQWRRRTALKMWTGWPTLPMVFIKGVLVGGAADLQALVDTGELGRMLAA